MDSETPNRDVAILSGALYPGRRVAGAHGSLADRRCNATMNAES